MPEFPLSTIPAKEIAPGYFARFIHTQHMTLSFVEVKAGSVLPSHAHIHEQISQLLEGEFELTVDGVPITMSKDVVIVIPPNVIHSGRALTDCKLLDTFSPVRADYQALQ